MALQRGQRHGYALLEEVGTLTGDAVHLGPGTLYRSLQRMRVEGWIEELDPDGTEDIDDASDSENVDRNDASHGDRRAERRRSYRITPAGRTAAQAEARRLHRLVGAAARVGLLGEQPRQAEEGQQ